MGAVVCSLEVYHTIEACVRCAIALATMRVEFLLGEYVAAALRKGSEVSKTAIRSWWCFKGA